MKILKITLQLSLFLSLGGCYATSHAYLYKKMMLDGTVEKYDKARNPLIDKKERVSKEYCIHMLALLIPLNFWDLRFTDMQEFKTLMNDLQKEGINGIGMEDVKFDVKAVTFIPLYGYGCTTISGILIPSST